MIGTQVPKTDETWSFPGNTGVFDQAPHGLNINLNLRMKTKPVTADATVYVVWLLGQIYCMYVCTVCTVNKSRKYAVSTTVVGSVFIKPEVFKKCDRIVNSGQ